MRASSPGLERATAGDRASKFATHHGAEFFEDEAVEEFRGQNRKGPESRMFAGERGGRGEFASVRVELLTQEKPARALDMAHGTVGDVEKRLPHGRRGFHIREDF
jgi:hypothetical protein